MPCDVLGLGCATVDDLLHVPAYPPADTKVQVQHSERQCGGLGATALVAAARMQARCAYASVLGPDELSGFVEQALQAEGIDTGQVARRPDARPIHSVIIVDQQRHTRNIFFDVNGRTGADDQLPPPETIQSSRVLFVDHYGMPGNLRAARIARAAGVAIVADLERQEVPLFAEVLALVDHLILSAGFALELTGATSPDQAVQRLCTTSRSAVVVTCGAEGCWYLSPEQRDRQARHLPAFPVQALDTTGCGDVFHGAYAAALAFGWPLLTRLHVASAAAAIKACHAGGQKGIPRLPAVREFLARHGVPCP